MCKCRIYKIIHILCEVNKHTWQVRGDEKWVGRNQKWDLISLFTLNKLGRNAIIGEIVSDTKLSEIVVY